MAAGNLLGIALMGVATLIFLGGIFIGRRFERVDATEVKIQALEQARDIVRSTPVLEKDADDFNAGFEACAQEIDDRLKETIDEQREAMR